MKLTVVYAFSVLFIFSSYSYGQGLVDPTDEPKMESFKHIQMNTCWNKEAIGCIKNAVQWENGPKDGATIIFEPQGEKVKALFNKEMEVSTNKHLALTTASAFAKGIIVKEKGHYPNPKAEMSVLKAFDYTIYLEKK